MNQSPTASRTGLRALPRNVWVMTLTSFLTDISSEMVFNLLPLFLANVLGVKTNVIGLIEGLAESTASLLKVFSGWLSDKLRRRKSLTVFGYGLSSLVKPFLYIVTGWPGVLAVRFADRVGKGIRTAPRDALIADSIDPAHRGLAFGLHRAGDTLGAMTGLIIALALVLGVQAASVSLSRETFQAVVLVSIVPAFLAVGVLVLGARDVPVTGEAPPPRLSLRDVSPAFRRFLGIVVLFTLGNSADAFLILRAQERGVNVAGVLGMLITFNLVYSLVSGPAGALSDRFGRRRLILAGWTIYGLIYLGFALVSETWQVWALYALYGLYYGVFEGTAKAFVADLVPAAQRGTAYGLYNAAVGLVALPASLMAGILWQGLGGWQGFGPSAPFLAGAILALAAMALLAVWKPTG
ncbi:MAG: MFS transporter [Chloroflexi bacterium]|nr:MFS transporter [Chloroflexota bacterium]MDL1883590.1 MFS transporter [Anaerolineae bacterium CFX8]